MRKILVIGAGASGMMAAICAAKKGAKVTIYEKNDRVGKKILATGNGKCNLSNTDMDITNYYCEDYNKLDNAFKRFSCEDTILFFENCGLMIRNRDGYLYPYCEQASVVLDILRSNLERYGIEVYTSVTDIVVSARKSGKFSVKSSVADKEFDSVILACGSKAGMKHATTDGYDLAKAFGHRIVPLFPALVQVRCREKFFPSVAGVRCKAKITLFVNEREKVWEQGELQLTDYGVSGIPVFQISRIIAKELSNNIPIHIEIDFVPEQTLGEWETYINNRIHNMYGCTLDNFMTGILHKKISAMLLKQYGLKPMSYLDATNESVIKKLCLDMKKFTVVPKSVNDFEFAQVCSGGVEFTQLNDDMESLYQPGLYIVGEMVDIDGKCGGYNLQWAWTSGYIAGTAAASK